MNSNVVAANSKDMEGLLRTSSVVPVLTINHIDDAVPLSNALVRGGLPNIEVTLRTDCSIQAVSEIKEHVPDAIVGGGTVITKDDLDRLKDAGASFAVSPGIMPELLSHATKIGLPYLPGISTVSELMLGISEGYRCFKFFPAEASGGVKALKSFAGPFGDITFCPTGGINRTNFQDYLALPNILCVGGSWVVPKEAVTQKDWNLIQELTRETVGLTQSA